MDDVITVKDLYKIYRIGENRVRALDGVSFTVHRGEFCAIVGASGSGKSTLLNMMAGLEKPTKGEIIIGKDHIEKKSENQLVRFRRRNVGFIFQSFNLLPTLNALENVALPLTFQGMSKKRRLQKAEQMLKLVGLSTHMRHKPTQMSGGQQQRVGIARALVAGPKIIFADEPTGNLDSVTSAEVMGLIKKIIREHNQTLVMVTHDDHLASFADRIFRIRDGKIISITEPGKDAAAENADETIDENAGRMADETIDENAGRMADGTVDENAGRMADRSIDENAGRMADRSIDEIADAAMEEIASAGSDNSKEIRETESNVSDTEDGNDEGPKEDETANEKTDKK
ncbi:MAG: ATP-binding cassette domain-containing protein [Lachnospiraceae bacterium]|nr:ATP-binding cassette domain-containing protein [Lachnospiraceae bacterium]